MRAVEEAPRPDAAATTTRLAHAPRQAVRLVVSKRRLWAAVYVSRKTMQRSTPGKSAATEVDEEMTGRWAGGRWTRWWWWRWWAGQEGARCGVLPAGRANGIPARPSGLIIDGRRGVAAGAGVDSS